MTNWGAGKKRALMRRRGTEGSRDNSASMVRRTIPDHSSNARRPAQSKDDLRAVADAALAEWQKRQEAGQ